MTKYYSLIGAVTGFVAGVVIDILFQINLVGFLTVLGFFVGLDIKNKKENKIVKDELTNMVSEKATSISFGLIMITTILLHQLLKHNLITLAADTALFIVTMIGILSYISLSVFYDKKYSK